MSEPVLVLDDTRMGYCVNCQQPGRVGALRLARWPHAAPVCPACLRGIAARIELNGAARPVSDE